MSGLVGGMSGMSGDVKWGGEEAGGKGRGKGDGGRGEGGRMEMLIQATSLTLGVSLLPFFIAELENVLL